MVKFIPSFLKRTKGWIKVDMGDCVFADGPCIELEGVPSDPDWNGDNFMLLIAVSRVSDMMRLYPELLERFKPLTLRDFLLWGLLDESAEDLVRTELVARELTGLAVKDRIPA